MDSTQALRRQITSWYRDNRMVLTQTPDLSALAPDAANLTKWESLNPKPQTLDPLPLHLIRYLKQFLLEHVDRRHLAISSPSLLLLYVIRYLKQLLLEHVDRPQRRKQLARHAILGLRSRRQRLRDLGVE